MSEIDVELLKKRRHKEKQIVCQSDDKADSESNGSEWYAMSAEWLKDWKMFVNNKRSKTAYGA